MSTVPLYPRRPDEFESFVLDIFFRLIQPAKDLHLYPNIPTKVLSNAESNHLRLQSDELLMGIYARNSKDGFAFTTRRIYWKNPWEQPQLVTYSDVIGPVKNSMGLNLELGGKLKITISGIDRKIQDSFVQLVTQVSSGFQRYGATPPVLTEASGGALWHLAVSGRQYGPYDAETLRAMVTAGQVSPSEALVWRDGMASWLPLAQVPELVMLPKASSYGAPPSPPPLSTPSQRPQSDRPRAPAPGVERPSAMSETADGRPTETLVREIFVRRVARSDRVHLAPNIPPKVLEGARAAYLFEERGESLIAIIDDTYSRNGKDGIAFTSQRVCWRNSFEGVQAINYAELLGPFKHTGGFSPKVELGHNAYLKANLAGPNVRDSLVAFLNDVTTSLRGIAASVQGQSLYAVVLTDVGRNKIQVVKSVRQATGLGLKEALDLANQIPATIKGMMLQDDANLLATKLREAGATIEVRLERQALPQIPASSAPVLGSLDDVLGDSGSLDEDRAPQANTSLVDLNNDPLDSLLALPGITLDVANALAKERARRGGFETVEEAGSLLELQPHQVEQLRELVILKPYQGPVGDPSAGRRVIDF